MCKNISLAKKLSGPVTRNKALQRRLWKLKDNGVRNIFKHKCKDLADVEVLDLWISFKDEVLNACKELSRRENIKRKGKKTHGGGM